VHVEHVAGQQDRYGEKGEALMCSMGEKQLKKERKIIERDDDRVFICLISDLAKPFTLPGSWEPAIGSDAFVTSVLEALYRLQPRTSTNSCPFPIWKLRPTKPPRALLARAHQPRKTVSGTRFAVSNAARRRKG